MKCRIRKWKLSDARDLAVALSNKKVQDNLPVKYPADPKRDHQMAW